MLDCGSGKLAADGKAIASVRHHDIHVGETRQADANCVQGTVARQIYMGAHRDYLVTVPGGETIRAIAPVEVSLSGGDSAWLHFPKEKCRALSR